MHCSARCTLKGSAHMAGILPVAEIATPLEKMVKEFKTNLIQMDLAEAELLHEAESLLRQGLVNLDHEPLAPIEGAPRSWPRCMRCIRRDWSRRVPASRTMQARRAIRA